MKDTEEKYFMKLFVATGEANSIKAQANLSRICEEYLPGRHEIEVIDVVTFFDRALEYNIFLTPTAILITPQPTVTLLGNLGDTETIIAALRLTSKNL